MQKNPNLSSNNINTEIILYITWVLANWICYKKVFFET